MLRQSIRDSSLAALAGVVAGYGAYYGLGVPMAVEAIAEWIMAETPSAWAVPILSWLGAWAKPWAMTGGLATLGFLLWLVAFAMRAVHRAALALVLPVGLAAAWLFDFPSWTAGLVFWLPAGLALAALAGSRRAPEPVPGRREFLISTAMAGGTLAVAGEAFVRNEAFARLAVEPVALFPMPAPPPDFAPGLVRKAITPVGQFYVMSKNSVDPVLTPGDWRLRIKIDGREKRVFTYSQLLSLPREERYQTLRCISNTLKTDLMSTAYWSGVRLSQLVSANEVPPETAEVAVLGVDGHGCSYAVPYAFGNEFLLALGMNGRTLDRNHGYPLRLLVPRYYGFKNIKWIGEIDFVTKPYFGTWPRKGFSKEAIVHTASYVDRVRREGARVLAGGVSFAGSRGIQRVDVRLDRGEWVTARLEKPLSQYTWTRWSADLPWKEGATVIEARALDGAGRWQAEQEKPQFPDGVAGPTIRRLSF